MRTYPEDMLWASLVFVLFSVFSGPGSCCDTQEYQTPAGECCPMCHEGTFVQTDCTPLLGTRCRPCVNGTYMKQPNGLKKCFSCSSCVADNGLFVWQKCTNKSDTVCDVLNGFFCKSLAEDTGCSLAEKHTRCTAGQRIKEPGTDRTDTVCEDCQKGFFSRDGVQCTPWTICSETQVQVKDGSPHADMQSGESLLVKPITKCESSTQTDLHPVETNIVKSYEWNEWELQRKAIRQANLRTKVTHSAQTDLSHMRRENITQTWLPKDAACQSKRDGESNVPRPQVYLAGLRGQRDRHMVKTNLTRSVDE